MSITTKMDDGLVSAAGAIATGLRTTGWRMADECITAAMALIGFGQIWVLTHDDAAVDMLLAAVNLVLFAALLHGARRRLRIERSQGQTGASSARSRERPMRLVGLVIIVLMGIYVHNVPTIAFELGFICAIAQSAFKSTMVAQRPA